MEHQQLVNTVMDLDENIRFATICNMAGDMEVTQQRSGIEKFLTQEETERNRRRSSAAKGRTKQETKGKRRAKEATSKETS